MLLCSRREIGLLLPLTVLLSSCSKKDEPLPLVFRVKFTTTAGDIVIEAHHDWAPRGVDRFTELLKMRYFDQGRFFRVVPGFIAQFGVHKDYDTHKIWRNLFFVDDHPTDVTPKNVRGTLSFAQSGPNTRATEIFINLADNHVLDEQQFVPFAKVVEGMDVVDKLYSGYGDLKPEGKLLDAGAIEEQANAYLEPRFPKLDYIKRTEILR